MAKSKETANTTPKVVTLKPPTAETLARQIAQTRLRTIVHVADGHRTAAELARATGVSQAHMSNVLIGRRNLSPALADRLNRTIDQHERENAAPFGGKAA